MGTTVNHQATFSCQQTLPRQPIPDLTQTCHKLLEWSKTLLTAAEHTDSQAVITQFLRPNGEGELLQQALVDWQQQHNLSNWSAPAWRDLYLESRDSLAINSNVFYYLKSRLDTSNHSQAEVAAALIVAVYRFIALIDTQQLSVDTQKGAPLCMDQYSALFSSIRNPQLGIDEFKQSLSRGHIVLLHAQRIYRLTILDDTRQIRSVAAITADLETILTRSNNPSPSSQAQNLALLTSMPRDKWAESRASLLENSINNQALIETIEQSTFALCLDSNAPTAMTEISQQLLHGPGQDRFFDKTLQFIVFADGKSGINFEHTAVDGAVMLRLVAHIYDTIADHAPSNTGDYSKQSKGDSPLPMSLTELCFDLDDSLQQTISDATLWFNKHIADTQTRVLNFDSFGKSQIKQLGVSPDAFVQVALQLAEHKLYGRCYSAYEAVMTRTFLEGRIDVLYTVSPESLAFIDLFNDANASTSEKKQALVAATQKHVARANECRTGQGIYTHLLALKHRYRDAGATLGMKALPALFSDQSYQALTHSIVCTSTTSEYGVALAGYGPIVDDGYGIRYFTRNDAVCFNLTSRTAMGDKLDQLVHYIEQSLLEMATLMKG